MPLPIAHSLAGYALSEVQPLTFFDKKWKTILFFIVLANAPDFDFLPGFLVNDPSRFHHGIAHTLGAAVLVGLLGSWAFQKALPFWKVFFIIGGVYFSHLVLDLFTEDQRPPFGIMLLWPFTDTFYISSFSLFKKITRSNESITFFPSLFSLCNLGEAFREFGILGSACLMVKLRSYFIKKKGACQKKGSSGAKRAN